MRVLLCSVAERTTFMPMVPLGWALQAQGCEVLTAVQPDLVDAVTASGLRAAKVGRDHQFWRVMKGVVGFAAETDVPGLSHAMRDASELDSTSVIEGYRSVVPWWWRSVNDPMIGDLVDLARRWRPDLVIWETVTFAGPIAAAAVGCRHARFVWTVDVFAVYRRRYHELVVNPSGADDPLQAWLSARAASYGATFDERMVLGEKTITFLPESLRWPVGGYGDDGSVNYVDMQFIPYNGRAVVPSWLQELPSRRRVVITLGTSAIDRFGRYVMPVRDIVLAVASLYVEVVVTVPASEHAALGALPSNVRLESFVPLDALMATTAVVVDHGGPSTVCTVARHGVPQLVVHAEFDAPVLGELLSKCSAGKVISPGDVNRGAIRSAVVALRDDPAFSRGAQRLAAEIRAMPTPATTVTTLHEWVSGSADFDR